MRFNFEIYPFVLLKIKDRAKHKALEFGSVGKFESLKFLKSQNSIRLKFKSVLVCNYIDLMRSK